MTAPHRIAAQGAEMRSVGTVQGCAAVGILLMGTIFANFMVKQTKCFKSLVSPPLSKKLSRQLMESNIRAAKAQLALIVSILGSGLERCVCIV